MSVLALIWDVGEGEGSKQKAKIALLQVLEIRYSLGLISLLLCKGSQTEAKGTSENDHMLFKH